MECFSTGSASVERLFSHVTLRNQTAVAHYDRAYQNFVPGAANATATLVSISACNNATVRTNVFNQTDLASTADLQCRNNRTGEDGRDGAVEARAVRQL